MNGLLKQIQVAWDRNNAIPPKEIMRELKVVFDVGMHNPITITTEGNLEMMRVAVQENIDRFFSLE